MSLQDVLNQIQNQNRELYSSLPPAPPPQIRQPDEYTAVRNFISGAILAVLSFKAAEKPENAKPAVFAAFLYGMNKDSVDDFAVDLVKKTGLGPKPRLMSKVKNIMGDLLR
jgi:hypothetical protein